MKELAVQTEMTPDQMALIKSTIAKGASNDELKLFLYRCKSMGLDPLKAGQIHFIKYGSSPGTIVIGIDGFRSKAEATGKHTGTQRGVIREGGKCVGAWCEVYRSDWSHPAREEVSMAEYNTGKAQWQKMPETMLKKVAEAAALRMAFPDVLGGVYTDDEMGQAKPTLPTAAPIGAQRASQLQQSMASHEQAMTVARDVMETHASVFEALAPHDIQPPLDVEPFTEADHSSVVGGDIGAKVITVGRKYRGQTFDEVGPEQIKTFCNWVEGEAQKSGKPIQGAMLAFLDDAYRFMQARGVA